MSTKSNTILGMSKSYNSNSLPQFVAIQSSISFIEKAIDVLELVLASFPIIIAYSSTSIHWLSRNPCNVSNHCMPRFAQGTELMEFKNQAANDHANFFYRIVLRN